jgi:hypothetical protein
MNLNKNNKSFKIKDACKSLKKCLDSKNEYVAIEQAENIAKTKEENVKDTNKNIFGVSPPQETAKEFFNYMTIKELAKVLNCSVDTIRNAIKKVYPTFKFDKGKNYLNKLQVIEIKEYIEYTNISYDTTKKQQKDFSHLNKSAKSLSNNKPVEVVANAFLNNFNEADIKDQMQMSALLLKGLFENIEKLTFENGGLKAENDTLKIKVGLSQKYYSIKKVAILNNKKRMNYSWRLLTKESVRQAKEIKSEIDNNYGNVNSYHIDVWKNVYPEEKY